MNNRKSVLIEKLNKIGVFYKGNQELKELPLPELEYYCITKKCQFTNIMVSQHNIQPTEHKIEKAPDAPTSRATRKQAI